MKQVIDLDNWNRKEHFAFFSAFDDPFFGITTLVDFTDIYRQSKELNVSFFLYSLHFLLKCANETDAFKLRIEKDSVVRYDTIHISPTIGREDGTFGFGFFEYDTNINRFIQTATQEIERVKNGDSVPRISTGKLMQEGEKHLLPISICVHHGLMDGRDVADLIQKLSNSQTAS